MKINNLLLSEIKPPVSNDDIMQIFADHRCEFLQMLSILIYHGPLWMIDVSQAEDYLHDFFIMFNRRDRIRKWDPDKSSLAAYIHRSMVMLRGNILRVWKCDWKIGLGDPGRAMYKRSSTTELWSINNLSSVDAGPCHGSDSTDVSTFLPILSREYREQMPDDRYRGVYDNFLWDKSQVDTALEMGISRATVSHIQGDIDDLLSGREFKFIESFPQRKHLTHPLRMQRTA